MGAWGLGPFENDSAMDWTYELEDTDGLSVIRDALEAALVETDFLDADEAQPALAAAEIVDALARGNLQPLPEDVREAVGGLPRPDAALIDLARRAAQRVLVDSETRDLWEETSEYGAWQASVTDLITRLGEHIGKG